MGTKYSSVSVSGYNSGPPSDDGTVADSNKVQWSKHISKIGNPLKTALESVNTALVTALNESARAVTGDATVASTDHNKTIEIASTISPAATITLADAATIAAGFIVTVVNLSPVYSCTIARTTASDTINGVTADLVLTPLSSYRILTNAAADGYLAVGSHNEVFKFGIPGAIGGLVQSQAADTDHDTTISAGVALDANSNYTLRLSSAITKAIDSAWQVGTNQGGLDGTESVAGTPDADTWYYVWLIARSDTGVVDALYSESATSPTMPTNYDYKRLIGAVLTDGSANIIAYDAYETAGGGLEVRWDTPVQDINLTNTLTTTARTDTLSVPTAFSVVVEIAVVIQDSSSDIAAIITCPDQSDAATSFSQFRSDSTVVANRWQAFMRTSASGTIRSLANTATVDLYTINTFAFAWSRR